MKKFIFLLTAFLVKVSFALQGGPVQPDYVQFEPSGMQDMVNLLTGDFSYQVPLADVPSPYGKYPLSVSYHAGITPQQEATWVGLGWSLNPGVITRNVRGIPDDQFHGGTLGFIYQYAGMQMWNVDMSVAWGPYGLGMSYSSDGTVGYSATIGANIVNVVNVGFTLSTDGNFGLKTSVGNDYVRMGSGLSYSMKTRRASASSGAQLLSGRAQKGNVGFGQSIASVGMTVSSNGLSASAGLGPYSVRKSRDGINVSVQSGPLTVSNSVTTKGKTRTDVSNVSAFVTDGVNSASIGYSQITSQFWQRSATSDYVYGYMYQAGPSIDVGKKNAFVMSPDAAAGSHAATDKAIVPWKWSVKGRSLEMLGDRDMVPAYDVYSVASEGVSGSFRPFARESHRMYRLFSDFFMEDSVPAESYSFMMSPETREGHVFQTENEFVEAGDDFEKNDSAMFDDYRYCVLGRDSCSVYGLYKTNYQNIGNRLVYNSQEDEFEERGGMRFIFMGGQGGYYESEDESSATRERSKVSDILLKRTLDGFDYPLFGSKKIEPLFDDDTQTGKLSGFVITIEDGTRYYFEQPVKSYLKVDYTINQPKGIPVFVDYDMTKNANFWERMFEGVERITDAFIELYPGTTFIREWWNSSTLEKVTGIAAAKAAWSTVSRPYENIHKMFMGHLDETCDLEKKYNEVIYTAALNLNPYATQWLLTEIRGADFVKLGDRIEDNVGYNLKFHYTEPSIYKWRSPYARPGLADMDLPNLRMMGNASTPEGCDTKKYQASFGVKENVYLESIESATHVVKFKLNEKERVDGKGWDDSFSLFPMMVQASVGYKIGDVNGGHLSLVPKYLYFNSPLSDAMQAKLYRTKKIHVFQDGPSFIANLDSSTITGDEISLDAELSVVEDSYTGTQGDESSFGLYRVEVEEIGLLKKAASYSGKTPGDGEVLVFGNGGHVKDVPYMNWANVVLSKDFYPLDRFENQMRYLEKVSYYTKRDTANPYREYIFGYDYSLQPRTLNSYCQYILVDGDTLSGYPSLDGNLLIRNSPDSVGVDVCDNATTRALYGKLTLRTITERGCQYGKCASLPPFRFDYLSPSASPIRYGKKEEWEDAHLLRVMTKYNSQGSVVLSKTNENQYEHFLDVDATIMSTTNAVDEYGLWSSKATVENHSVNQSLADYEGSAWSLNKVVDPAGGVLEVEYERDVIGNGESYGDDYLTAEVLQFFKCSAEGYAATGDELCLVLRPLYWHDQCLGPREASWDTVQVEGDTTDGYAYLDKMGITGPNPPTVFFNIVSGVQTNVNCGFSRCKRDRETSYVGAGEVLRIVDHKSDAQKKVLVLDADYADVYAGMQRAASQISKSRPWSVDPVSYGSYGTIWTRQVLPEMKAGNLRVSRLTRHDIDVKAQTNYDYGVGETAQLADSLYSSVMVNRFYRTLNTYTKPNMNLQPISRIVGFNDRDADFIPAPQVMYPKVSVSNSWENDTVAKNGRVVFDYITPESGIPADFVDSATKAELRPFLKLNLKLIKTYGDDIKQGHAFRISLLDTNGQELDSSKVIMLEGDRLGELYFYSDSIRKAKTVKVSELKASLDDWLEQSVDIGGEDFTSFNEVMLAIRVSLPCQETNPEVERVWVRHHRDGMFPILYKKVAYGNKPLTRYNMFNRVIFTFPCPTPDTVTVSGNYDSTVTFYDLTSFVGLNYRTTFYRGNGNSAIQVKMDSTVYSTMVPDYLESVLSLDSAAAPLGDARKKIGSQVEHWNTTVRSECRNQNKSYCKEDNQDLFSWDEGQLQRNYTHIRKSPFQVATVTKTGYDNNPNAVNVLLGTTRLENHAFDPATGLPTVSQASVGQGPSTEMRKLTRTIPFYSLDGIALADSMFVRNMLSQSFANEVYSGTLDGGASWDALLAGDNREYLRSFSISPFGFVEQFDSARSRKPIVSWGNFTSKKEPSLIYPNATQYADANSAPPPLTDYSGNDILSINGKYKVTEMQDVYNRRTTAFYSMDGMFQVGLFYPSSKDEAGLVVPYQDTILSLGICSLVGSYEVDGGIAVAKRRMTISYSSSTMSLPLVAEYRMWTRRNGWTTKRENVPFGSTEQRLVVPRGGRLNYFRVYPEASQAKTFIYDKYGNMVQTVSEDNTSAYYEYDPLSGLVQVRNDDGIAFKAHHREWMNGGEE